ncbi:folylpolyglutamate synthase [Pseudogymnoascus verrucosus]|uniref:Dihydrofolate synthetase n=1 Tax=Pseudogymnoascus verrucosus TaxID=342668 RepID=A0A1B8GEC9_9PEZI|nr:folylpolyglutamate synthase [Pseudogymnoascus verrucosus]OBT94189.1 folylpolyglutamate synthase [Pseudogymnoascus verrucosus]
MIELGLMRIARLVQHTPQTWKAIHVAGTNGKGTICAYLSAMLQASGVRSGRFTSPHLIDRWDCITINDKAVQESVFLEAERLVNNRNKDEGIGASEFELLTATAFEIFAREKIEMGVIEVGLGGRLDATNILENKAVTVISKMGIDHQSFLGNTLEEIALQKAGIMRPGVPCVLDSTNPPSVREVVEKHARDIGTKVALSAMGSEVAKEISEANFEPHQLDNLACAYNAFQIATRNPNPPLDQILPAVRKLQWPGRLQQIGIGAITGRQELTTLDGAHNAQSAAALGAFVDRKLRSKSSRVTWVLAASAGKELDNILKPLVQPGDNVVTTEFGAVDGMPWVQPMSSKDILSSISSAGVETSQQHDAGSDVSGALRWAADTAAGGPLVIAGSLYLVSDVLRLLRSAESESK